MPRPFYLLGESIWYPMNRKPGKGEALEPAWTVFSSVIWSENHNFIAVKIVLKFYSSLIVHLGIILVNNQLDATFQCIYLFHFSTCFEQPSAHHQENRIVSIHHLVYITVCRWLSGMPVPPDRHTRQSPTQSDIYQMMYWYNSILLMMSTGLLETCREVK
jgi:hypothetical protein